MLYIFLLIFGLLELERYRYDIELVEFYKNNILSYLKSLINSVIFITNYGKYRFNLNLISIHNELIKNHDKIVSELENALNNYHLTNPGIFDDDFQQENEKYGYYFLKYYGNIDTQIAPSLKKLVEKNNNIYTCFISVMDGKIDIPEHRGPYAGILRYHYTLFSCDSKNDYLGVEGEKIYWKEKEGFLFDDTYLHFVKKKSEGHRISVIIDIERELFYPFNLLNKYLLSKISVTNYVTTMRKRCVPLFKKKLRIGD